MNRRQIKAKIREALARKELSEVILLLQSFRPQDVVNHLFSSLCATSDRERFHAISCLGILVPRIADENMESARIIMRRFLWMLNDESGGIGWGAPEAMAEIMANDDRLAAEYMHMLISYMREDGPELFQDGNYLELPMLQRGLLWGIGRLCQTRSAAMRENGVADDLRRYLDSADGTVRGLAVWCLSLLGGTCCKEEVMTLLEDQTEFSLYLNGEFVHMHTAELARKYGHA